MNKNLLGLSLFFFCLPACKKGTYTGDENRFPLEKYSSVAVNGLLPKMTVKFNQTAPHIIAGKYFLTPGQGWLQILDSTGKTFASQEVNIAKGSDVIDIIKLSDTSGIIIRNTQESEPKPDSGYIKIKFLNLAVNALGDKDIDIVNTQYFPSLKPLPGGGFTRDTAIIKRDTLWNVGSDITDVEYKLLQPIYRPGGGPYASYLSFLRSTDKTEISTNKARTDINIITATTSFNNKKNTVFTYAITDAALAGSGKYAPSLRLLFENKGL